MKTYRRHNCAKEHRTYRTWALCKWKVNQVWGEGEYAMLTHCDTLHISLWADLSGAIDEVKMWTSLKCGSRCVGSHEVVRIVR
jgi:hypothetical protein